MLADRCDGVSFLPRTSRTRALLAVLALADAKPVSRKLLISLLWPSRGREQAQASLRQSVHELRNCLSPVDGVSLQSEGDRLTLRMAPVWIDAVFVRTSGFLARHVADVFRGPLMGDLLGLSDSFDAWIMGERTKLSGMIRSKLDAFLAASTGHDATVKMAEAILSFDSSHETAWMTLAGSYMKVGNPFAALDVYHRCISEIRSSDGVPAFDVNAVLAQCISGAASIANGNGSAGSQRHQSGRSICALPWRAACVAVAPTRTLGNASPDFATFIDWQFLSALCKFDDLSCIPVSPRTPEHLAADGFDFLLEGCIGRVGDQDQFGARLRHLHAKGEVIWSQQICRPASRTGLEEADFATALAPQIADAILKHQAMVMENYPDSELNVCELVLRASRSAQRLDRQSLLEADTLLSEALKRNDRHPALLAWLSYVQLLQLGQGWVTDIGATQRRIGELVDRGLSLNPDSASVLSIAGHVLAFTQNRLEEGLSLQERALSRNPNLPSAWLFSGLAHTYAGEHKEAISRLQRAKLLSPADQQAYFIETGLSLAHLLDGDTENALRSSRNAIRLNPNFSSSFKVGVSASGYSDPKRSDPAMLNRLLVLEPTLTVERVLSRNPLKRRADQTRFADGLRMAGLPK